jgi:hypothetical protein
MDVTGRTDRCHKTKQMKKHDSIKAGNKKKILFVLKQSSQFKPETS